MIETPPITADLIDRACENVQYHHFPGTTMTVCCITLPNGYTVIGKSAAADPEQFDAALGQEYALQEAKKGVADLLAYDACSIRSFQGRYGAISA